MNTADIDKGIRTLASPRGVEETLDRLASAAKDRGMTVFTRIDFTKDAAAVGLSLRPTQLLILGNPTAGTPLMVSAPSAGLDLPLKVLAWQDEADRCWVSFNVPEYLQKRHGFAAALVANIAGLARLIEATLGDERPAPP
jgi:uncharacterized protein (DUF302 family)